MRKIYPQIQSTSFSLVSMNTTEAHLRSLYAIRVKSWGRICCSDIMVKTGCWSKSVNQSSRFLWWRWRHSRALVHRCSLEPRWHWPKSRYQLTDAIYAVANGGVRLPDFNCTMCLQCHLDRHGASNLVVDLIMTNSNHKVFLETVELGIALLEGGNGIIQVCHTGCLLALLPFTQAIHYLLGRCRGLSLWGSPLTRTRKSSSKFSMIKC